ncbi:MAG TPA: hypothetical protein VKR26_08705 [Terriglobales bacterium]|nr:hypothetical protein [Terriglobales bacterium]
MQEIVLTPEQIAIDLDKTIQERERELERLKAARQQLGFAEPSESVGLPVSATEFHDLSISKAVTAYLHRTGKPIKVEPELREVLTAGGCNLGKVPKRSTKLGVVNGKQLHYDESSDMVYLREWKEAERPSPK